jgi:hypothetical protein
LTNLDLPGLTAIGLEEFRYRKSMTGSEARGTFLPRRLKEVSEAQENTTFSNLD